MLKEQKKTKQNKTHTHTDKKVNNKTRKTDNFTIYRLHT